MGITRCATTQYALTAYYCGDEVANGRQAQYDLQALSATLEDLRGQQQGCVVFRCSLNQQWDSVGHTWIIVTNEDGSAGYWLQSYIQQVSE